MDNTQTMFRTIINNQSAFRQEVLGRMDKLDQKLTGRIDSVEKNLTETREDLTGRLDKIGRQLAYLEDDTPTLEDIKKLEKRVEKVESKTASAA